jgi:hypothetical protein
MSTNAAPAAQNPAELSGPLLLLDLQLFVAACDVKVCETEDEAREAIARFLAGDDLALEQAS